MAPGTDACQRLVEDSGVMHSLPARTPILPILLTAVLAGCVLLIPTSGESLSVVVTRTAAEAGASLPGATFVSDAALAVLAAATAGAMALAWMKRPASRGAVVASAAGVMAAYAGSELLKLVFAQARPCTRWMSVGECQVTDYSFPSNHATLAFAAVWVIAVASVSVSSALSAIAIAAVVSAGRLLEGVHYLHDVAAGALVGIVVPACSLGAWSLLRGARARIAHRRFAVR